MLPRCTGAPVATTGGDRRHRPWRLAQSLQAGARLTLGSVSKRERDHHPNRVAEFRPLGFYDIVALDLADEDVSVSWVRCTLLEKGATHEQAARCVLGQSYRPSSSRRYASSAS